MDSESGRPEAVLEQIVHACLGRQKPSADVNATELRANIDERLRNQSPKFLSWAQESRDRLDSAQAEAGRQAGRTEFAGWAIAGALAVYLALALGRTGRGAGLDAEIIGGLAVALVGRLAWRLRLFARGERKISDARKHWEKVLEEAIALPLIAQEMNLLLGVDVADTMNMAVATLTGNGRDPEVPVISAAMKNVATTARTIGSGSIGISGPRGAGKSTVFPVAELREQDLAGGCRVCGQDPPYPAPGAHYPLAFQAVEVKDAGVAAQDAEVHGLAGQLRRSTRAECPRSMHSGEK
jgi:hypothetical protein